MMYIRQRIELVGIGLHVREIRDGLGLGHGPALVATLSLGQLQHLLLDGRKVIGGNG